MNNIPIRHRLLITTMLVAMVSTQAEAQSGAATTDGDTVDPVSSGDIIVTAQRRSERLRDVPLSITAITGDQLEKAGIRDTLSLTSAVPGLKMDRVGTNTLPAIRGVTTQVTSPGSDANVAIYVDGVYQPAPVFGTFDIPDISRVEVLKGPQGTLFGRNATGGAIQIFTRDPSYTTTGSVVASYGSFNDTLVKGFVSVPLVADKVAISVSGLYDHNDGYLRDFQTRKKVSPLDSRLLRGKLRLDPTDDLKIILTGFYARREDASNAFAVPLDGNSIGRTIPGTLFPPGDPYLVAVSPIIPQYNITKSYGFDGRVEWQTDIGTLKSITAYAHYRQMGDNDADNTLQPPGVTGLLYNGGETNDFFSQEISFASALAGRFDFVVGGYFSDGSGGWTPLDVLSDVFPVTITSEQKVRAYAAFGELYFRPTDRLSLIAGLRYSSERRTLESALFPTGTDVILAGLTPDVARKSWNSATPRFSIKYALTPTTNVYFTYSQGFKSGVFQSSATSLQPDGNLPLADPEKIRAYEAGFKGRLGDFVDLSIAAFHYDYKDVQVNAFTCVQQGDAGCVNLSVLTNAASARINGLELDATVRPTSGLSFRTGISLLDAKYKSFPGAPTNIPVVDAQGQLAGNQAVAIDASGNRMLRAPKFTINETVTYSTQVAGGDMTLTGTVYHTSSINYSIQGRIKQKPYTTIDARAAWTPDNSGLTLSVFGKNLTDTLRVSSVFSSDAGDSLAYMPGRTWGIEASYQF